MALIGCAGSACVFSVIVWRHEKSMLYVYVFYLIKVIKCLKRWYSPVPTQSPVIGFTSPETSPRKRVTSHVDQSVTSTSCCARHRARASAGILLRHQLARILSSVTSASVTCSLVLCHPKWRCARYDHCRSTQGRGRQSGRTRLLPPCGKRRLVRVVHGVQEARARENPQRRPIGQSGHMEAGPQRAEILRRDDLWLVSRFGCSRVGTS